MPTPSLQTLVTDAQAVLALQNMTTIRSTLAVALANANTGTPLNPGLTNQQLINEARQVMTLPKSDIESIIVNQLMKFLNSPPAPGGAGANKQVIWNDAGILTGAAGLIYDGPSERLTVGQRIDIWKGLLGDSNSVAVGRNALSATQAGATNNTAVGNQAGQGITTGANNALLGANAGLGTATGSANTAFGNNALQSNTAGNNNVAIGSSALASHLGDNLVGVGFAALQANTTGIQNTAVGRSALAANTTSNNSTAVGFQALQSSTAANNTAVGALAGSNNTTGSANTTIGQNSLNANTTGSNNASVGSGALAVSNASSCTAVGSSALVANTSGSNNTALGASAGSNITTGTNNICIGVSANAPGPTAINELCIGGTTAFVATNGGATTYYNTASAGAVALPAATLGFIRIYLNGSYVKIPVYGN